MTEIPESLLRRSAEAKAKALGLPVEQVLAEMKGETPPPPPPDAEPESPPEGEAESAVDAAAERSQEIEEAVESVDEEPEPVEEAPPQPETAAETEVEVNEDAEVAPAPPTEAPEDAEVEEPVAEPPVEQEPVPAAVATAVEEKPAPSGNGAGNGKAASVVTARPVVPPKGVPEGVRTQRLLTVVKARAIQTVKAEPTDKVNTWPHLMLMEFGALLAITAFLVILSVIIHSPLLDPANFNATPNPSKAPWYFLGLQELLSYFDPQIAGVMVPTVTGIIGFILIPYVDKNPSNRPSDRKFAIALYSVFLAGAATLTIIGVLFRGRGFNFSYPWKDGVFFDDLKDWVHFE
ncbi:MAG TPA: hypothetical protein VMS99_04135 [Acidimicrobiia bacterium]|nr:hypothetical protein [Acidimicrobiia bacterium]